MNPSRFQIVVAHYNEDLSWLHAYASNTIVYSKGLPPTEGKFLRVEQLPNIGRESHSYLHHLFHSYDSLADITMFTQGDIYNVNTDFDPHSNLPVYEMVSMALKTPRGGITSFAAMSETFIDWDGIRWHHGPKAKWLKVWGTTLVRARLTPAEFWKYIHGEEHPRALHVHAHCLFAIRAETARRKPKEFWQKLLNYFENNGECNPEEGIYMDRFWFALFSESHIIRGKSSFSSIHALDSKG